MIKSIMSKKVLTVTKDNLLREVISIMDKHNFKEIPVINDNKQVTGVISYFDILDIIRFRGDSKVENFMSPAHTISEEDKEEDVLTFMINSGLTGLPVTDKTGKIIGFLSDFDLIRYYLNEPLVSKKFVSDSNVKQVNPVLENSNIGEVKNIMNFNKRDRLPVVDSKGKFIGAILLIDLLRKFYVDAPDKIGSKSMQGEMSKVMQVSIKGLIRPGASVRIDSYLKDAMRTMVGKNLKGLIVLNSLNEPIGVIDRCSILKTIESVIKRKGFDVEVLGELNPKLLPDVKGVISSQFKILPRDAEKIKGIKLFIKRVHNIKNEGKVEMNMTVIMDGGNLNIKKEGFDILLTLVDCLDTAKQLLKNKSGKSKF